MPPPGGGGGMMPPSGGSGGGGGLFGTIMLGRKFLSVSAIIAVIVLEGAVAIQDVQMSTLAGVLQAKNSFRKRDLVQTGLVLAAKAKEAKTRKGPEISCGYYSGFDVPAVTAGKGRSMMFHFANCIFLCALLWLERPGPLAASEAVGASRFTLPPVGNVGLVTFSLLQMWLGSSVLNHYIGTVPYIAAFALVVVGILGLLFSLVFMSKLKLASSSAGGGGMPGGGMMMDEPY